MVLKKIKNKKKAFYKKKKITRGGGGRREFPNVLRKRTKANLLVTFQ